MKGVDEMELFGTAALVAALVNLAIGIWIYKENSRPDNNRRYLLVIFLLTFWGFTEALTKFSPDQETSLFWAKTSFVPFSLLPFIPYHLAHRFSNGKLKILLYATGILCILFITFLFADGFIQGISETYHGYEPVYGELFPYFVLIFISGGSFGFLLLYLERTQLKNLGRIHQIDVMIQGLLISALFVYTFELISPLLGWGLPKIGSVFTIFSTVAFRYAHIQYDITIHPTIQESVSTKDAPCGALCSLCSSFSAGRCESCAMGAEEKRKECSIYVCAKGKGITCTQCDQLLTCSTYGDHKEECPFCDPVKHLPSGTSYKIESSTYDMGRAIFRDRIVRGDFGLVISREHPDIFFKKWDLEQVPMIWLSVREENKRTVDPTDLAKLAYMIENFIRKVPVSVVLFEGFEYLALYNSFDATVKLVYFLEDEAVKNKCRFIVSYDPRTIDKDDLALLENELNPIPEQYLVELPDNEEH